jgi:hypothetical protein
MMTLCFSMACAGRVDGESESDDDDNDALGSDGTASDDAVGSDDPLGSSEDDIAEDGGETSATSAADGADAAGTSGGSDGGDASATTTSATSSADDAATTSGTGVCPEPAIDGLASAWSIAEDGDLVVHLASVETTCEEPIPDLDCPQQWRVEFSLSPKEQTPGTYDLLELGGWVYMTHLAGKKCAVAATMAVGTLEIDAVADGTITGRICGLMTIDEVEIEGAFVTTVCGG